MWGSAVRMSMPTLYIFLYIKSSDAHTITLRCSWSQAADELGMDSVIRAQMEVSSDDLRRQLAYIADQLVSDAPGAEGSNSASWKAVCVLRGRLFLGAPL